MAKSFMEIRLPPAMFNAFPSDFFDKHASKLALITSSINVKSLVAHHHHIFDWLSLDGRGNKLRHNGCIFDLDLFWTVNIKISKGSSP